ncbi:MetQ/NlpA family ABC transporter substrate-binding protein [Nocardioides pacificus]
MSHTPSTPPSSSSGATPGATPGAGLVEAPKRKLWPLLLAALVALAVVVGLVVALTGGDDEDEQAVRIGVVDASEPYWDTYVDAAADEGIEVELVNFSEYTQPNPALSEAEIDLNQFQHIVYLADYNVANDDDLQPVGATAIYPLGLYSKEHDAVEDIPDGATVVVPNDPSNQARALLVLQSAGLIELTSGGTIFSDLADVSDSSRVEVKALDAALTAPALDDVAAAIVNNDFVEKAGLKFADAIAQDDPSDPNAVPYVNVFAARAADADDATYRKLVEIYQDTAAVQEGVQQASGDTAVLLETPVADLVESLKKVESDTRDQKG